MPVPERSRPTPEQLLKQVEAEERHLSRGKLKVFLGYASGVGKSFRMLDEGRRLLDPRHRHAGIAQRQVGAHVVIHGGKAVAPVLQRSRGAARKHQRGEHPERVEITCTHHCLTLSIVVMVFAAVIMAGLEVCMVVGYGMSFLASSLESSVKSSSFAARH